ELVAHAALGIEEEVERGVRVPLGRGFAGRVAADRQPIVLADVDHADVLNPILREKGIKSLLGVPLLLEGSVIGVLHVGSLVPRARDGSSSACSSSPTSRSRTSTSRSSSGSSCAASATSWPRTRRRSSSTTRR